MIQDAELQLSKDQAVTASAASTDVIDLGVGDKGAHNPLDLVITVKEAATAAGAATVTFLVQTDDDDQFGTVQTVLSTAAIGKAALVLGTQYALRLPQGLKRYLRVYYTVATGPLTAGKFDASLVNEVPNTAIYPDARTL